MFIFIYFTVNSTKVYKECYKYNFKYFVGANFKNIFEILLKFQSKKL